MRSIPVLLLSVIVLCGCDATAQDHVITPEQLLSDAAVSANLSALRIRRTHTLLHAEGLIRDQSGSVSSIPCSEGQEHLMDSSAPPLCDELSIESLGTTYRAFLFSKGHNTLVIYHEGHHGCESHWTFADVVRTDAVGLIARLLERADVLYIDMPLVATNCGQEISVGRTVYSGISHNWFAMLDKPGESSLAYFFNHIYRVLNFLGPRYAAIHMVGRSGGGWATTIYAALDSRISRSVSVAGSLPIEFRGPQIDGVDDLGDWEQYGALLFRQIGYQELYEAAGGLDESRRHVQIYNEYDNCCFSGAKGILAANEYAESENGYRRQQVKFLVNVGETLHLIPIEMVLTELFDP